jgi:DNA-directed RNA polymerase subunit RPC12/RpoP
LAEKNFDKKRTKGGLSPMVGRKRGREELSGGGAIENSAGPIKKRGCGARGKFGFECTMCGKACSRSDHLTEHMRTHSGDRPYVCTTCGQAFSLSSTLTAHMRTHSGDRPYACTTCGQAFSESGNMTDHRRTQTGERPYACTN